MTPETLWDCSPRLPHLAHRGRDGAFIPDDPAKNVEGDQEVEQEQPHRFVVTGLCKYL